MERDIDDVLSRGVGVFVDPEGAFKEKLTKKTKGEYEKDIIIKFGVDPTRPDIHLGHAVIFRKLRQFQELGAKVVFLVGDYTAQIGDPTGKSKVRPEINQEEVERNMKTFLDQVGKILRLDEAVFSWIRNSEWFTGVTDISVGPKAKVEIDGRKVDPNSFIGKAAVFENTRMQKTHLKKTALYNVSLTNFLSILRRFTHSRLIARDLFQDRIKNEEELFMHEMMYPVLQGIDSSAIAHIYGSCDLEIGGTDQTFNMLAGRDVMKMSNQPEQSVLALEILPGTDGVEKMSKSLDNYIAVTDSPNDMYGKIMSLKDEAMPIYFNLATYIPAEEILGIEKKLESGTLHPRDAKMHLARAVVSIYHGDKLSEDAEKNFIETFSKKGVPDDLLEIEARKGDRIADLLLKNGLVQSKTEWRRLVEEGAVSDMASGEKIISPDAVADYSITLKIGKRRFVKINM